MSTSSGEPNGAAGGRIAKALAWRWPRERLLFTTACRVDRMPTKTEYLLGVLGRMHCPGNACVDDPSYRNREALLGITRARLIYQTRGPHGLVLRMTALSLVGLAVLLLFLGDPMGFVVVAGAGAAAWFGSRVAEWFGLGSGHIEIGRVRRVDRAGQRIEGVGNWGTLYRLHIPDPSDFRLVAAVLDAAPPPAAAA